MTSSLNNTAPNSFYPFYTTWDDVYAWIKHYRIERACINSDDLSVNVNGDVNLSQYFLRNKTPLTHIPIKFNEVRGKFSCEGQGITDLSFAPRTVEGHFMCGGNQLTSLRGAPERVGGTFYAGENQLTSLEGSPRVVKGQFDVSYNQLLSLEGGPIEVGELYEAPYNQLTNLKGLPEIVHGLAVECNQLVSLEGVHTVYGNLTAVQNQIASLYHFPQWVNGSILLRDNPLSPDILALSSFEQLKEEHLKIKAIVDEKEKLAQTISVIQAMPTGSLSETSIFIKHKHKI